MEHLPPILFVSLLDGARIGCRVSRRRLVMLFPVLATRFAGKLTELEAAPVQTEETY